MCQIVVISYLYSPHNNSEERVPYACLLPILTKLPTQKIAWDVRALKGQLTKQDIKQPIITLSKTEQGRSGQISRVCRLPFWLWVNLQKVCSSRPNYGSAITHRVPQAFERGCQEKMFVHLESVSRKHASTHGFVWSATSKWEKNGSVPPSDVHPITKQNGSVPPSDIHPITKQNGSVPPSDVNPITKPHVTFLLSDNNIHLKGGRLRKSEGCFKQWERLWAWCTNSKQNYFEGNNKTFYWR